MTSALSSPLSFQEAQAGLYDDINFEEIDEDLASFQEDEMVQQALHRGVDLKKYGNELERELRKAESESVVQYVTHHAKVLSLHHEMTTCDQTLGRMEEMLHGFMADLAEISNEIKHLQSDSLSMSVKLKNRRTAEDMLNHFVERSHIPMQSINAILSPNIDQAFLDAIIILSKRLYYFEMTAAPKDNSSLGILPADTCAGRTLYPELEKLKLRSISKIKDYFSSQFMSMRKPKTNVQVLQQTSLVKYAALFQFVQKESVLVADDLRSLYVESMGRTLLSLFKSYYTQLARQELIVATKSDLIAVEEAALKSLFTQKVDMTKRGDSFSLSGREKVLEQIESEPLLVHVALAENQKLPYEVILRSVLKHLVDAATNEFLFIIDFFKTQPKDTFNRIFGRTISMLLENIENYLLQCYDAVGILIMIRMVFLLRLVMQRRRIPILDPFFDRLSMLLWPRFKQVLDSHIKSLKGAGLQKANLTKLGNLDLSTPHVVCRRYAELIASVSVLQGYGAMNSGMSAGSNPGSPMPAMMDAGMAGMQLGDSVGDPLGIGGGGEHMVAQDIHALRVEMIALLERLAVGGFGGNSKEQRVFFINNYDLILSIYQERGLMSEEVSKIESLLLTQRELFAEEEVKIFFPKLISFVLSTEQQMNNSHATSGTKIALDDSAVETLVRDFAANWRTGIQQINDDVLHYFANFRNGMEILKQVLTQLLLYYTRFQDLIKRGYNRPPAFNRDIVSTATILMEIKRYSRTF